MPPSLTMSPHRGCRAPRPRIPPHHENRPAAKPEATALAVNHRYVGWSPLFAATAARTPRSGSSGDPRVWRHPLVGVLRVPSHVTKLWLLDSIVDGVLANGGALGAAIADAAYQSGPPAHIERSTILGRTRFLKLEMASETIFSDVVLVEQRQQGCVRFSFVPRGSLIPQQYRCQPALEIGRLKEQKKLEAAKSGTTLPPGWETALEDEVVLWLVPSFESDQYGRPEFVQLRRTCPVQIRTGSEDGAEMGVFCTLKQPQRESNLKLRLDEYLPVGLEAGLLYVT